VPLGPSPKECRRRRGHLAILKLPIGSHGVDPMSLESRVSYEQIDYELAEMDPGVPVRLCASGYHMAASRSSWPGVRMLHRLRTRATVFASTNENRHQTGTSIKTSLKLLQRTWVRADERESQLFTNALWRRNGLLTCLACVLPFLCYVWEELC
jgi:hypothetical protein